MNTRMVNRAKKLRAEFDMIRTSNEQFARASRARKRVLIAKDVLKWLDLGIFRVKSGNVYCVIEAAVIADNETEKAVTNALNIDPYSVGLDAQILSRAARKEKCLVCAIGSILCASALRYDAYDVKNNHLYGNDSFSTLFSLTQKLKLHHVSISIYPIERDHPSSKPQYVSPLSDYFSNTQLALIEMAFERSSKSLLFVYYDIKIMISNVLDEKARKFGRRYSTDRKCLMAICRNIIRNKGTFKP